MTKGQICLDFVLETQGEIRACIAEGVVDNLCFISVVAAFCFVPMCRGRQEIGDPVSHLDHPDLARLLADAFEAILHLRGFVQALVFGQCHHTGHNGLTECFFDLSWRHISVFYDIVKQRALKGKFAVDDPVVMVECRNDLHADKAEVLDIGDLSPRHTLPNMSDGRKLVCFDVEILGPKHCGCGHCFKAQQVEGLEECKADTE